MQKFKVAISRFPANDWEAKECVEWLIHTVVAMKKDERIEEVISIVPGGQTPITMLRNKAVVDAKSAGATHLLMIDSDMAPDLNLPGNKPFWPTAWEFMLERRAREEAYTRSLAKVDGLPPPSSTVFPPATISAPYCGPSPFQQCYVFQWASRRSGKPEHDFILDMISRESAAIRSGIQEVAAMATGLILYDMRVFDVLPPPWYCYEWADQTQSEKATTEDVYQTRNASLLGLPQFCAWDSWAGHRKPEIVGKPQLMTRDMVHESLRAAVMRGVDRGDRLIMVGDECGEALGIPADGTD